MCHWYRHKKRHPVVIPLGPGTLSTISLSQTGRCISSFDRYRQVNLHKILLVRDITNDLQKCYFGTILLIYFIKLLKIFPLESGGKLICIFTYNCAFCLLHVKAIFCPFPVDAVCLCEIFSWMNKHFLKNYFWYVICSFGYFTYVGD